MAFVQKPADKPPILPYGPVEPPEPSLGWRMAVGFLHVMPWLPLYVPILAGLLWGVGLRFGGRRDEPFTTGELLADLWVAWIVVGVCVTAFHVLRKRR
jgi:hypothetical protein